jgi:Ca-activated chloride channel family protein
MLLTGLLLAVLALAGPVWEREPQPLFRQQSALVVLFDLSRSMQAADLKPSRFLRARLKVEDLLRQRKEGQTALIVFAADAFTVTPLTEDRHTIEALIKSLEPGMMPVQGSDPARAIRLGLDLLQQAGAKHGRLLLVTDEDRPESTLDAARQVADLGFELAVLGVGTAEGAPIPQADGGFVKDPFGNMVLPQLNVAGLQRLANAGGGPYQTISVTDADLQRLLSGLDDQQGQPGKSSLVTNDLWREEGFWLLWPLLLLAASAFRRGWLLVFALILLFPPSADALSWDDLWQTPDQQAAESFAQQDYADAAQKFKDSRWKASALYRAGKYAEAAEQLKEPQTADDFYNQGNALARQGDLQGAIQSYQTALEKESDHADARFNKELVEKELQKQEQNEQDQKQEQQQDQQGEQGDNSEQSSGQLDQQQPDQGSEKSQQPNNSGEQQSQEQQQSSQAEQGGQDNQERAAQQDQSDTQSAQENKSAKKTPESSQANESQEQQSDDEPGETEATSATTSDEQPPETKEQRESRLLLQQIPDDPGGLLRRKFLHQYRQRGQQTETDRSW